MATIKIRALCLPLALCMVASAVSRILPRAGLSGTASAKPHHGDSVYIGNIDTLPCESSLELQSRSLPAHEHNEFVVGGFSELSKRSQPALSFTNTAVGNKSIHAATEGSDEWQKAVRKGTDRLRQLTDPSCAQPPAHSFIAPYPHDLDRWGWQAASRTTPNSYFLDGPFGTLALSIEGAERVSWEQKEFFQSESGEEQASPRP